MAKPFTSDEDTRLLTLRGAGQQYKAIEAAMSRTAASLRCRYGILKRPDVAVADLIPRACLRCRNPFMADGRFNRLCSPCGVLASDASPMMPVCDGRASPLRVVPDRSHNGEAGVRVIVRK